jgi:hypothetical protein
MDLKTRLPEHTLIRSEMRNTAYLNAVTNNVMSIVFSESSIIFSAAIYAIGLCRCKYK